MTGRRSVRERGVVADILKRVVAYGLLLLILASAQCAFFARLEFLPAAPNLILCTVVAVALTDSIRASAAVGIAGGILLDSIGGVGISLSPLLFFLAAWLVGSLAAKMMQNTASYALLLLPTTVLFGGVRLVELLIAGEPVFAALRLCVVPELLCTFVLGLPLYGIVKLCTLLWKRERGGLR